MLVGKYCVHTCPRKRPNRSLLCADVLIVFYALYVLYCLFFYCSYYSIKSLRFLFKNWNEIMTVSEFENIKKYLAKHYTGTEANTGEPHASYSIETNNREAYLSYMPSEYIISDQWEA